MDHTFIMAYICVYFVRMKHTFIVVLLECFVALYYAISRRQQLNCGIPQGSVLGPLLFTIYCKSLTAIFARHHLKYRMYAVRGVDPVLKVGGGGTRHQFI